MFHSFSHQESRAKIQGRKFFRHGMNRGTVFDAYLVFRSISFFHAIFYAWFPSGRFVRAVTVVRFPMSRPTTVIGEALHTSPSYPPDLIQCYNFTILRYMTRHFSLHTGRELEMIMSSSGKHRPCRLIL